MPDQDSIAAVLHDAVCTGDFAAFGRLLADDAVLDTCSERGRRHVYGRAAILEHLSAPGPGEVVDWDARDWDAGAAITFEWSGADDTDRRRWYLRRTGEEITALYSYTAAPRSAAAASAAELSPALLERIGHGATRSALAHGGNSGAALERVKLADGTRLIAKRIGPDADWLGRITRDRGRTALLWEAGAFERMPAQLDHGIEDVLRDGDGWWVVMRDLSATFLADDRRLTHAESRRILDAAAAMHAAFAGGEPPDGAVALEHRLGMSSPRVADVERAGPDLLPKQLEAAWDAFADSMPQQIADEILAAAQDPAPLAAALRDAGPVTLLHGDLRDDNLGLADDRIVLLDWDLATAGTPTVEFAWYLCHDAWRVDATHDQLEGDFRAAEGRLLTEREVELGLLTGLVQYGWIFGHSLRVHPDPAEAAWARTELDWWLPRTSRALEYAGGMPR